jgi:hypothetical protein
MTVSFNTKTIGGRTDAGPMEHKARMHRERSASGAVYGWLVDDDDPSPTSPAGPSWDTPPSAEVLERAMSAGKAAMRAGYGRGPVSCGTCPACTYGRPQHCRRPPGKAMAQLRAAQAAADRVDAAEATSVELQRVIFHEEQRRQQAF